MAKDAGTDAGADAGAAADADADADSGAGADTDFDGPGIGADASADAAGGGADAGADVDDGVGASSIAGASFASPDMVRVRRSCRRALGLDACFEHIPPLRRGLLVGQPLLGCR